MLLIDLIDRTTRIIEKYASVNTIHASEYKSLLNSWNKLKSWAYPQLTTDDMQIVIRCKNCRHYKRYKQKDNPKAAPFWACSKTKTKRDPDFFCKDGDQK